MQISIESFHFEHAYYFTCRWSTYDCENGQGLCGGLCAPPENLWSICVIPLNASNYITI